MVNLACMGECMIELNVGAEVFGAATRLAFGGDSLNTAVYMRRALAADAGRVAYVTALGDDAYSAKMIEAWRLEGLDDRLVYRLPGCLPGLYAIQTDSAGERSFDYWREDAAARRLLDDGRAADLADALAEFDLLYLSGITVAILWDRAGPALLDLLGRLRTAGTRVAFDSNHRPRLWPDGETAAVAYRQIGELADVALPTFGDEQPLFGDADPADAARRWLDWGGRGSGGQGWPVVGAGRHGRRPRGDRARRRFPRRRHDGGR
jgi:2-dehydro-3-deoxygluconokinase